MFNRVEYSQSGVSAVTRQQDDFDPGMPYFVLVQRQQFPDQGKGDTRLQKSVLTLHLVVRISLQTAGFEDRVALSQVKESP